MSEIRGIESLPQRADYTFKFNARTGRHGWLRLTPAYSLKIVEEILDQQTTKKHVLDPFCGTGTTALCAAYRGHESTTIDVNPFLLWLSRAKISHYSSEDRSAAEHAGFSSLKLVSQLAVKPAPLPTIHNIERWWQPDALEFLRLLKTAIFEVTAGDSTTQTLLMVAFCRSLISLSAAAFNHQSMSFRANDQFTFSFGNDMAQLFTEDVQFVLKGAAENPVGNCHLLIGDSRNLSEIVKRPVDLVVTSPPYANRMSYIRELRPYMYWLDFLESGRAAGELDWKAIGGTWGIATSRLSGWDRPVHHFNSATLEQTLEKIAHGDNKNGALLANYVAKYFDDMWAHFQNLRPILAKGADLHYIIGNSTFYGVLVPTEQLFAEMLILLGFDSVQYKAIRKRNSKKELVEFDVTAKWMNN